MPSEPASQHVADVVIGVIEDMKGQAVKCLDVSHLTTITDLMIVASGRSDRHVRSIAEAIVEKCKEQGIALLGVEGEEGGEWVLVDLADVIVHVMLPRTREFYDIEKLWDISKPGSEAAEH
jgi:ribosome-associated protein